MTDEKTILAFASHAYNCGYNKEGFIDVEALAKWAELSGQPAAPAQPVAAQPQSEWDAAIEAAAEICEKKATSHGWNYHSPSMGGELAHSIRALKRQPAQPESKDAISTLKKSVLIENEYANGRLTKQQADAAIAASIQAKGE